MTKRSMTELEAALAAAEQRIVGASWQPIETAPKDGTRVLVFCPEFNLSLDKDGPRVMEARWSNPGSDPRYGAWGDPVYEEWNCEPTHWMPLPEPPVAIQVGGVG